MLFTDLIASLKAENNNSEYEVKRRHTRRDGDHCVAVIDGSIYPVQNWSMGGTLIRADERLFGVNDEIPVTMKFKLGNGIRDIPQLAKVIRKSHGRIALQFAPLTQNTQRVFQRVINDCMSTEFVESQMA